MISDVGKYINFLIEHELTERQFLYLWLIHTKDKDIIAKYKRAVGFDVHTLDYLIENGWVDDFGLIKDNVRTFNVYDFIVTDKFTKTVVVDEFDAFDELKAAYPKWFRFNGKTIPSTAGDPVKLSKMYFQYHKGNRDLHNKVLEVTKKYHADGEPKEKFESYIANKRWLDLIEKESSSNYNPFTIQ